MSWTSEGSKCFRPEDSNSFAKSWGSKSFDLSLVFLRFLAGTGNSSSIRETPPSENESSSCVSWSRRHFGSSTSVDARLRLESIIKFARIASSLMVYWANTKKDGVRFLLEYKNEIYQ